jgi:hypothetical protein
VVYSSDEFHGKKSLNEMSKHLSLNSMTKATFLQIALLVSLIYTSGQWEGVQRQDLRDACEQAASFREGE